MDNSESTNPYASPQTILDPAESRGNRPGLLRLLFSFQGRSPRRIYWYVVLGMLAAAFAAMFAIMFVFGEESDATAIGTLVIQILMVWVSLAAEARRWHDHDKSAAWILIRLIPIVGAIWVFIEVGCLRGTRGRNRYGPDPT